MPEKLNEKTVFTLREVTNSIKKTLDNRYQSSFWVKAEMNKLNYYKHSGHCYPELVEKQDGKVIAQIKSILWKNDFIRVNNNFQRMLNEPLKEGIKILFQAKISFDDTYGLALTITDIDPSFTLGDLEKEKQDTIRRLRTENIFNKNKALSISILPKRIAIISVETSKGYADFLRVIESNSWNYKFFHMLFPSLLQGDKAVESILSQLKRIKRVQHHFDIVAIIRGGGGDIGLSCYNNYKLVKEIALFPIPVMTGIGHATNETVVEMISFSNAITPTKLAEDLIQRFHNYTIPVQEAERKIIEKYRRLISEENNKLQSEAKMLSSITENSLLKNKIFVKEKIQSLSMQSHFLIREKKDLLSSISFGIKKDINNFCNSANLEIKKFNLTIKKDVTIQINRFTFLLNQYTQQVMKGSKITIETQKENMQLFKERFSDKSLQFFRNLIIEINNIEKNINNMSPKNVMKRGYSITLYNGKAVKNFDSVIHGETLTTVLFEGEITSIVKSTYKSEEL